MDPPQPTYHASVSSELVRILSGQGLDDGAPSHSGADVSFESRGDLAASDATAEIIGFEKTVLRRDGARPLVLDAMLVWQAHRVAQAPLAPEVSLTRQISVYVTRDGQIAMHLSFDPGDALMARPVHWAALVRDENEYAQLLGACSPEQCFGVALDPIAAHTKLCAEVALQGGAACAAPMMLPTHGDIRKTYHEQSNAC